MTDEEAVAFIGVKVNEEGYSIPEACDALYFEVVMQPGPPNLFLLQKIARTRLDAMKSPDTARDGP